MSNQIYFDEKQLTKGNFFELRGSIVTEKGNHYDLVEWLGRGGNACVFKGLERSTGEEVAIKFLLNINDNNILRFDREIELLKSIQNPHIVKYFGSGSIRAKSFIRSRKKQDVDLRYILMELAECNLLEYLKSKELNIAPEEYNGQFRGLARALAELHNLAIHRDIKPENILVSGEKWLLSDYGLCSFVTQDQQELSENQRNIGPKFWLSPEGHNRRLGLGDQINKSSDVFQLAAIFWFVATGRHPCGVITNGDWRGKIELYDLLHQSLFHNPSNRPQGGIEFLVGLEAALT